MKLRTLVLSIIAVIATSCVTTVATNGSSTAPPGQVKKATGAKSAKQYAPGQHKKKKN